MYYYYYYLLFFFFLLLILLFIYIYIYRSYYIGSHGDKRLSRFASLGDTSGGDFPRTEQLAPNLLGNPEENPSNPGTLQTGACGTRIARSLLWGCVIPPSAMPKLWWNLTGMTCYSLIICWPNRLHKMPILFAATDPSPQTGLSKNWLPAKIILYILIIFAVFKRPIWRCTPFWDIPKPKDIYQRIIPMRSIVASRKISWGIWGFVPW